MRQGQRSTGELGWVIELASSRSAEVINAGFETPIGWSTGHLQTIRSRAMPLRFELTRFGTQRFVSVDLDDGTGDALVVSVHRSYRATDQTSRVTARATRPLVVLVHGLGGTAESDYVRRCAAGLLGAGLQCRPRRSARRWTIGPD